MSFSSELKAEIARTPFGLHDEQIAELSGFAHASGSVSLHGRGGLGLVLRTDYAFIARRLFLLIKGEGVTPQLLSSRRAGGPRSYQVILQPPGGEAILSDCSMLDAQGRPLLRAGVPSAQVRRNRQRRAYVRGVFLGCGTVTDPASSYHAEWSFAHEAFARDFAELLGRMNLRAKRLCRGEKHVAYLKEADDLAALMGLMGAASALFHLENTRIVKSMRGHINRQVNAEAANLEKTASAAARQLRAIEALKESAHWGALDAGLRAVAEARLNAPDASLGELGEALDPPLTKSGTSHRMRKLMEFAGRCGAGDASHGPRTQDIMT